MPKKEELNTEDVKPEMMEISRETLDQIIKDNKEAKKELQLLRDAVNQNKLMEAEQRAKVARGEKDLPRVFLKIFDKNIVTGWKTEQSELVYNPSNPSSPVGEILKGRYFYIDGSDSGAVDQLRFTRSNDRINCSILEDYGNEVLIRFDEIISTDPEVLSIPIPKESLRVNKNFINP